MGSCNKINDVLIIDALKYVFQRRSSEVRLPGAQKVGTIQK